MRSKPVVISKATARLSPTIVSRTYNASQGRFGSIDPIRFGSGTANLFGYVGNSPINSIDPSGMFTVYGVVVGQSQNIAAGVAVVVGCAIGDFSGIVRPMILGTLFLKASLLCLVCPRSKLR